MPSSAVQTCARSEEHTSELQSLTNLVCRLLLEKKNNDCISLPVLSTNARRTDPVSCRSSLNRPPRSLCVAIMPPHCLSPWPFIFSFFLNNGGPPESSPLPHPAALPI